MQNNYTKIFKIHSGEIVGLLNEDKTVNIFKGIPYAAPPVAELRWREPAPVKSWEGVRKCFDFSPSGPQMLPEPYKMYTKEFLRSSSATSEDCLYLNIWCPNDDMQNKPVVIYVFGGGFVAGGASCKIYDGETLAKNGVIFITFDFRLGVLGLLASPELSRENKNGVSGNYQLLDQIAAIKWVKNNIRNFGGDPDNITLMGNSSGAANLNNLMMSPLAKGLFKKVFAMSYEGFNNPSNIGFDKSNNLFSFSAISTLEEYEEYGRKLFGSKTPEELRKIPAEEFLKIDFSSKFVIDNYSLDATFKDFVNSGRSREFSYIFSSVEKDSMVLFMLHFDPANKNVSLNYTENLRRFTGEKFFEEALELYPENETEFQDFKDFQKYHFKLLEDFYDANMLDFAKARKTSGAGNTWLLKFKHVIPGPESEIWGAFHGSDVPYWLGYFSPERKDYWTSVDFELSRELVSRLVNFAKSGDPNHEGLSQWDTSDGDSFYEVNTGYFRRNDLRGNKFFNFWNRFLRR